MEMLPRFFFLSDKSKFTCEKYCCSAIKKLLIIRLSQLSAVEHRCSKTIISIFLSPYQTLIIILVPENFLENFEEKPLGQKFIIGYPGPRGFS